jgi:hypothetical protein
MEPMRRHRHDGLTVTAAAALLALQLLAVVVVPLSHQGAVARSLIEHVAHVQEAGAAEHTEPPTREPAHDEAACHLCRVADARYVVDATAPQKVRTALAGGAAAPEPGVWLRTAFWHFPQGPRPPPAT